jgi:outer membrane protein assembly factor BamE (lipoprotein component of BamABCDE complex)
MRAIFIIIPIIATLVLSGCSNIKPNSAAATDNNAIAAAKSTAGMNSKGEVVDSSKVEAGSGQHVKGLKDVEGEITGKPAANSQFKKLQIGMSMKQVTDLIGQPTDQGNYVTGKAWIPFYFGDDAHRIEAVYKGQGRLIFAGGSVYGTMSGGTLIWIIHNANEGSYR